MKRLLPKSISNPRGFTLIELLIVVAIIAILSAIGFAVYSSLGLQAKARNATRRSDIDSISKALEVNRTGAGYVVLSNAYFSNGSIPAVDPQGYLYCANSVASAQPADPASWTAACPANYGQVGTTNPPAGTLFKICTYLEAELNPVVAAKPFCKLSAQ